MFRPPMTRLLRAASLAGFLALGIAVAPAASATAAGFDEGEAAYAAGDYRAALAAWQPLAEHGDARAQFRVGELYREGKGVRYIDFEAAARWLRLAAAQGLPEAQYRLARLHYEGFLIPRDPGELLRQATTAAAHGHARAQVMLGAVYEYGLDDIDPDLTAALKWYELAATLGHDKVRALALQARDRVRAKMTPAQIAAAARLAETWQDRGQ